MLLGNIRPEVHSNCRSSRSAPHVTSSPTVQTPISTPSNHPRTPITSQQTMMNYARMSYRYTTVTLLSLRPQPEISVFPDHLVERRFLDEENYIDLDRMLVEKAGKFRFEPYGMLDGAGDGLIMPSRVHKYDFSDPVVIEKVKNRRPKDPMTPHQVAALTSVVTRHQPSTVPTPLLSTHPNPPSPHVWIDDYSRRQAQLQRQPQRNHFPPQPSMPYQRQNPNQCETYTNPSKPILPGFSPELQANNQTVPILQRLFQAQQQRQQHEQRKVHADQTPLSPIGCYPKGLSTFATPTSPQTSKPSNTFAWPFSTNQNQSSPTHPLHLSLSAQSTVKQNQDVLTQLINEHLRCSTTLQTPVTASGPNKLYPDHSDDEEDEQNFYSAPPSPTGANDSAASNLFDSSENPEQTRVYNQAVLLNTLIRNMVKEQEQRGSGSQEKATENVLSSASNESCLSDESQSTKTHSEQGESYAEMYNLVRLLSPGVKSVAQQELLQYLEQGCAVEREEMLRLVASLNINEQNALKPVLLRLINEQTEVMKHQQDVQQGQSPSNLHQRFAHHLDQSRSPLESWFGAEIYKNAFPRMPSGRVVSACDLEQSRLSQQN